MRFRKASALALGVLALGAIAGLGANVARPEVAHAQPAGQAWEVLVGTDVEEEFLSTQRYFPNPVTINVGDSVSFSWRGFHTVTFTGGQPLPRFEIPGTAAGSLILNPQLVFASLPPGQTNATYDGTNFINLIPADEGEPDPSAPPPSFNVTFTRAGTFEYFCAIHPGMRGEVSVAAAGAALPETPAQARARGQVELQSTLAALREAVARVAGVQPTATAAPGRTTAHSALVGLGSGFSASYMNFLPGRLTVRRGDVVVWTMPDPFEIHTVTFVGDAPPPDFVTPEFGPGGPGSGPPTLTIPANVVGQVGGDTFTGGAYTNSGILGPGQSYTLRIDAPAGTYQFLCIVHPFMRVDLTVVEP